MPRNLRNWEFRRCGAFWMWERSICCFLMVTQIYQKEEFVRFSLPPPFYKKKSKNKWCSKEMRLCKGKGLRIHSCVLFFVLFCFSFYIAPCCLCVFLVDIFNTSSTNSLSRAIHQKCYYYYYFFFSFMFFHFNYVPRKS